MALFEGNIFTHNHPGGRCFTQEDVAEFVNTRLHEARASTPQGTYYSIKESGGEMNRSIAAVMREERAGSYVQAVNILQNLNLDLNHLSGGEHDNIISDIMGEEADKWLINNAAEFGYIYTKGEI